MQITFLALPSDFVEVLEGVWKNDAEFGEIGEEAKIMEPVPPQSLELNALVFNVPPLNQSSFHVWDEFASTAGWCCVHDFRLG